MRQYVPGHWLDEIVAAFNARFGLVRRRFHLSGKGSYKEVQAYLQSLGVDMTIAQVKGYLARKRITMQVYGYFKKGCVPANKGKKTC